LLRALRDPEGPAAPAKNIAAGERSSRREEARVARRPQKQPRRPRRRLRLLLPVAVLVVMAFLYYRPLSTYVQTRNELGARRAQVVALRAEKARLERRLARTTSDAALAREARRIGYVKPGERLFIVKGISTWQRTHPSATP
jgi:cell division protein FtsB